MDIPNTSASAMDTAAWQEQMLSGKLDKKQQIDELAKQFESVLVRQFLDVAMKPMDEENGLFGSGKVPMYDQMIKDTLAQSIVKSSSLGFSNVLQAQLYNEAVDGKQETNTNE